MHFSNAALPSLATPGDETANEVIPSSSSTQPSPYIREASTLNGDRRRRTATVFCNFRRTLAGTTALKAPATGVRWFPASASDFSGADEASWHLLSPTPRPAEHQEAKTIVCGNLRCCCCSVGGTTNPESGKRAIAGQEKLCYLELLGCCCVDCGLRKLEYGC